MTWSTPIAEATAVAATQDAPGPADRGTGRLVRQHGSDHRVEEFDRSVQALFDGRIAHPGEAEHARPCRGLAQRKPTRATGQRHAQQGGAAADSALALDRFGLLRNLVEVQAGGSSPQ